MDTASRNAQLDRIEILLNDIGKELEQLRKTTDKEIAELDSDPTPQPVLTSPNKDWMKVRPDAIVERTSSGNGFSFSITDEDDDE